jgi:hypothetical protein
MVNNKTETKIHFEKRKNIKVRRDMKTANMKTFEILHEIKSPNFCQQNGRIMVVRQAIKDHFEMNNIKIKVKIMKNNAPKTTNGLLSRSFLDKHSSSLLYELPK